MDNDVLRQAPLFSALDDEAATALRSSMTDSKLRRGDVLFHEGDSGDKLYVVLEGQGVLTIGGEAIPVGTGQAVFVPAGADHRFTAYEGLSVLVIFAKGPS